MIRKTFHNYEEAIICLSDEEICRHVQKSVFNEGIFITKNKVFKITLYSNEAKACKRLIGKTFKNVCKIHNVYSIKVTDGESSWKAHVIEQEKLHRDESISFFNLDFKYIMRDINKRAEIAKSIINGLLELESIGITYSDLHSSNVMRDSKNRLKIIDFGFAKVKRI